PKCMDCWIGHCRNCIDRALANARKLWKRFELCRVNVRVNLGLGGLLSNGQAFLISLRKDVSTVILEKTIGVSSGSHLTFQTHGSQLNSLLRFKAFMTNPL